MKSKITEMDVARAIQRLKTKGMKPTLNSIRAELGNQGSKTTILRMVRTLSEQNKSANLSITLPAGADGSLATASLSIEEPSAIVESIESLGEARVIVNRLCLTIQHLKTELAICQSNNEALRSSQKQALEALRASIKL
ncbi:DNA-binding protein [Pseudomonas sp. S37]|uniref:DNA-binding protein n=1 Tax=Pseudomonas sp. S37 TaxID=2767449 RepID=UPI0019118542|nr:DNA-binding protein [Pseudomonas sp. S37]